MIELFSNFYRPAPPRILTEFEQWLIFLDNKSNTILNRYLKASKLINSVQQKLIHVLDIVDIPYLTKQSKDDFYIYINYFKDIKEQVEGLYNLHNSTFATKNQYINKIDKICFESTIPIFDLDYLSIWPMGTPYSNWKNKITPLYLHYHNSGLLTYNIFYNKIRFKRDEPDVAIFFIDIPSLCMKYFKWYLEAENKDIYIFITNEVWSFLIEQLRHIWLLRQHDLAIMKLNDIDIEEELDLNNKDQDSVGSRYILSINRLVQFYKEIQDGKTTIDTIFNSKLFNYQNNHTFRELVEWTINHLDVPYLSQYTWMRVVRDLPLLTYMIKIYMLYPEGNRTQLFKNIFEVQWKKILSKQPWDYIKTPHIKEWFKKQIVLFNQFI